MALLFPFVEYWWFYEMAVDLDANAGWGGPVRDHDVQGVQGFEQLSADTEYLVRSG